MSVRLCLVVTALALAGPALAGQTPPYDAATRLAIQDVITHQLAALRTGDGKAAEAFATPDLRTKFPDPDRFFDMVRANYGALIRPRSTSFGEMTDSPHGPLQKVTVVAADGTVWDAIYSFENVDGQWRISACGIAKDDTQQGI